MTKLCSVVVVTSVAPPTKSMLELAEGAQNRRMEFFCIGDKKSPPDWSLDGCHFVSLNEQRLNKLKMGKTLPVGHYARKNIGYLLAITKGAECIVETDDDNWPLDLFWADQELAVSGRFIDQKGWVNAYAYFTSQKIWPRGFPLEQITRAGIATSSIPSPNVVAQCPVQQGLANGDTDVDAVYRMTLGGLVEFERNEPLILGTGCWCPFNSQNTRWWRQAFEMLYLPSHCSFRMTDIWRSFVAQACLWANDWNLAFMPPSVYQRRNPHDLLFDFESEIPGYLNNQRIVDVLSKLQLAKGRGSIRENMKRCYRKLVEMNLIDADELKLLGHWFDDLDYCLVGQ